MKHSTFAKTAGLSGTALVLIAVALFFGATSTVEHANSQAVEKLAAELSAVHAELAALKTTPAGEAVSLEPLLGEIILFGGNFAPRGWAFCNGQLLPISQNQALFSILGTTYGGDGRTTFGLPDLRGRAPVGAGRGLGLSDLRLGERYGAETAMVKTNKISVPSAQGRREMTVVSDIPDGVSTVGPRQVVHFIIATQGVYPSRQ
ncbi:MAG: hypothetical protein EP344_11430 [Bacteroidetes bacterium]|nr:MAG: hypothetical protein EP344_11430 [Bacteroidota bacterium]